MCFENVRLPARTAPSDVESHFWPFFDKAVDRLDLAIHIALLLPCEFVKSPPANGGFLKPCGSRPPARFFCNEDSAPSRGVLVVVHTTCCAPRYDYAARVWPNPQSPFNSQGAKLFSADLAGSGLWSQLIEICGKPHAPHVGHWRTLLSPAMRRRTCACFVTCDEYQQAGHVGHHWVMTYGTTAIPYRYDKPRRRPTALFVDAGKVSSRQRLSRGCIPSQRKNFESTYCTGIVRTLTELSRKERHRSSNLDSFTLTIRNVRD